MGGGGAMSWAELRWVLNAYSNCEKWIKIDQKYHIKKKRVKKFQNEKKVLKWQNKNILFLKHCVIKFSVKFQEVTDPTIYCITRFWNNAGEKTQLFIIYNILLYAWTAKSYFLFVTLQLPLLLWAVWATSSSTVTKKAPLRPDGRKIKITLMLFKSSALHSIMLWLYNNISIKKWEQEWIFTADKNVILFVTRRWHYLPTEALRFTEWMRSQLCFREWNIHTQLTISCKYICWPRCTKPEWNNTMQCNKTCIWYRPLSSFLYLTVDCSWSLFGSLVYFFIWQFVPILKSGCVNKLMLWY